MMKYIANELFFTSRAKCIAIAFGACALFLIASQHNATGQWTQATGFSNSSEGNNFDFISGFVTWRNSIFANAKCGIDLLQPPGATPDSLFVSTDNGQTWFSSLPNGGVPLLPVANGPGPIPTFIGGAEQVLGDINISDEVLSYSTDGGQTWLADTSGLGNPSVGSLATVGTTIFASYLTGVYQQTAPGAAWTVDTIGIGYGTGPVSGIGSLVAFGNNLFLTTYRGSGGGILVSTDQGASWSSANNGLPTITSSGITQLFQTDLFAVSGSSVFAAVAHDTDVFGGADNFDTVDFYLTTNAGQSWSKQNSSIQNWGLVYRFTAYNQSLFAVSDSGFYYSTNSGSTWTQGNQGLRLEIGDYPNSVIVSGGNVVIGTNSSGAWYRPLSDFGVSSVAMTAMPVTGLNLALSQNPASSSEVKVTYTLSDAGTAQVMLMGELGRTVRMLQNGSATPGENTLTIDPLTLEVGTYFVRLTADGVSAMQKLVITR